MPTTQPQPKLVLRKSDERGETRLDWLESRHTFSFGEYYDPAHMGFRSLRVINDDIIAPAKGFGLHPHRDMEIISYIISGQLEHRDSMGNGRIIQTGEVQYMCAGNGVRHSEVNPSDIDPVHLLQIWILPNTSSLPPSYADLKPIPSSDQIALSLLASPDGADGSIRIHQDARLYLGKLDAGNTLSYAIDINRGYWIHVINGVLATDHHTLSAGDGLSIENGTMLSLSAVKPSQFLLFDLS